MTQYFSGIGLTTQILIPRMSPFEKIQPSNHLQKINITCVADFLNDEYSKHLRKFPGISSLNDDIYGAYLESHTTIKGITAEEIHNTGLDEIKRLQTEMMKVVNDELKIENVTFKQSFDMIKNDEKQTFNSEEEIMEYYTNIIRYDQQLKKIYQKVLIRVITNHNVILEIFDQKNKHFLILPSSLSRYS